MASSAGRNSRGCGRCADGPSEPAFADSDHSIAQVPARAPRGLSSAPASLLAEPAPVPAPLQCLCCLGRRRPRLRRALTAFPLACLVQTGFRRLPTLQLDRIQRRDALTRRSLQTLPQRVPVVRYQLRALARPADLHIEGLLGGQVRVIRFHRRDHAIDCPSLESVHGGRPGPVDMAQLQIVPAQVQRPSVLQAEAHPALPDRGHLCGAAVDQSMRGVVPGPAHAVAPAQLDGVDTVDLHPAGCGRQSARIPGNGSAVFPHQVHHAGVSIDAGDAQLIAFLDAQPLVGTMEGHHVAGRPR